MVFCVVVRGCSESLLKDFLLFAVVLSLYRFRFVVSIIILVVHVRAESESPVTIRRTIRSVSCLFLTSHPPQQHTTTTTTKERETKKVGLDCPCPWFLVCVIHSVTLVVAVRIGTQSRCCCVVVVPEMPPLPARMKHSWSHTDCE